MGLAKILEAGKAALSETDLSELVQAYRLLFALRDRARDPGGDHAALLRALALFGTTADERGAGRFNLAELFEDNEESKGRRRI